MPNNRCVSITSRPLLTSDAEFSVFIGPIDQVGWVPACAGVTVSSASAAQPRNGPPDAVSTRRATSSGAPERRHCARAECSESTGTIWPGAAALSTSGPPATSDSLLASASRAPLFRAARVGFSPNAPTSPLRTTSTPVVPAVSSTMRVAASGPAKRTSPSCAAARSSATAMFVTPVWARCAASTSVFPPPAANPTTSNRSGLAAITSSAWVPMDPVLPRIRTFRRRLATEPLCRLTAEARTTRILRYVGISYRASERASGPADRLRPGTRPRLRLLRPRFGDLEGVELPHLADHRLPARGRHRGTRPGPRRRRRQDARHLRAAANPLRPHPALLRDGRLRRQRRHHQGRGRAGQDPLQGRRGGSRHRQAL